MIRGLLRKKCPTFFSETVYSECMKIQAQYNPSFPLHMLFFHIISIYVYGLMPARNMHACLPCTSSFPVHVAMSSLHESRSRHLQTLSHAVHPSVAPKDENLTAPYQDYRGNGGGQSNQIWRLPPGFIDLCEGGHCRAESTCLLDSC